MPSTRSDPRPTIRAVITALLPLLLVLSLAACSTEDDDPAVPSADTNDDERTGETEPALDVAAALARALRRRADAVRSGDQAAFEAGVSGTDPDFVRTQSMYLTNLEQLPLGQFDYRLDRNSIVRSARGYWATVDVTLELEGYDERPVVTRDRYLFRPQADGRLALASVTNPAWERQNRIDPQPWDLGPITVRSGAGVLGVFDAGSAVQADGLVSEAERGITEVAAEVPFVWDPNVVLFALSDADFMSSLEDVPGGEPLNLDAVTFQVPARPGSRRIADTRIVLNPRMVAGAEPGRGRLVRHELTHVAVGDRAAGVPTWLIEGLAEYVSVRPLPPEDRAISEAALAAAEAGLSGLPSDEEFAGPTSAASYGVAWWVCEYLARSYSESILWSLLEVMPEKGEEVALADLLVTDEAALARRAGRLMLATYQQD